MENTNVTHHLNNYDPLKCLCIDVYDLIFQVSLNFDELKYFIYFCLAARQRAHLLSCFTKMVQCNR